MSTHLEQQTETNLKAVNDTQALNLKTEAPELLSDSPTLVAEPETPLRFSLVESLLISTCIVLVAILAIFLEQRETAIAIIASIAIVFFLLILNRKTLADYRRCSRRQALKRKAELSRVLYGGGISDSSTNMMRVRAIQYSQDLIDDYKKTRRNSRNIYYIFQISTIVLSGVTPILVLLDKVDIQVAWIKWLPVIFPAIASIVTSLATSFPFQENWMSANRAVELLEAEQEKFILGVTPAYRLVEKGSNLNQEPHRKRRLQESVDNFIAKVNQIHLKQFIQEGEPEAKQPKQAENEESISANS